MDLNEEKITARDCLVLFLVIAIWVLVLLTAVSCSTEYIPIETVHTEYRTKTDTLRQTDTITNNKETVIREVDSAFMARYGIEMDNRQRAWLVLQKEMEQRIRELEKSHTDTVIKVDSIDRPVYIEKKLSRWERMKMEAGQISIIAVVILLLLFIYNKVLRK